MLGSIPFTPTIFWGVGLLGDGRLPFKEEITGSKPVRPTKIYFRSSTGGATRYERVG